MTDAAAGEFQHNSEIHENLKHWQRKPLLQKIYLDFYKLIAARVTKPTSGKIVELGSGIGNLKLVLPDCICTDIFPNAWIDQVENAYKLSFPDQSVSNIILFDVWHHLEFPGDALKEFHRVLKSGGRVIIFDPAMSLTGILVYGLFHHEPLGLRKKITWRAPEKFDLSATSYYAAQGNASRIFSTAKFAKELTDWNKVGLQSLAALSYVASGGYRGRQLYPTSFYSFMKIIDAVLNFVPGLFATRMIVVLEKK